MPLRQGLELHERLLEDMARRDISEAENTFSGFVTLMKWGTIISVIAAAFVILLIA